jgi:preprotein translocase subunit SecD
VVGDQDENAEIITNRTQGVDGNADAEPLYVQKAPLMDATAIQSADVVTDASTGSPQIEVVLTEQGRQLFAKATKENLNRRLAIVLDGQSYFAPKVRDEITGGRIQLTGAFTDEQARELVDKINEAISRQ